jgi:type I restriction enzyme, R subunit
MMLYRLHYLDNMTWQFSEDNLIEQTAIDLFFNQLGWDKLLAYNKEENGEGSTLHKQNTKLREARDILLPKLMNGQIEV